MRRWLERRWWQAEATPPCFLQPLAKTYAALAAARARHLKAQQHRLPVPVIVVGNIAIGGTGKTPVTLWLVELLIAMGHRPGIISRGYGGNGPFPLAVTAESEAARCGDEPLLLAQRSGVPVMVAPKRVAAGLALLRAHPGIDVLVCDDGLQHYALARSLEICVIDGFRGHGNGALLPAGPLREPTERLADCDWLFVNGADASAYGPKALRFDLKPAPFRNLLTSARAPLEHFRGQTAYALAGIGHPQRFFAQLLGLGIRVIPQPKPDHHHYTARDLQLPGSAPILMTEKDAVKCQCFADARCWALPVTAEFEGATALRLKPSLAAMFSPPAKP
jgi:tetraacyldisaccharide 4'-kinase